MAPWSGGGRYLNLTERAGDARDAFGVAAFERLTALRAAVDPGGVLRVNHPLR
jgi:hypothetical protein